MEDQVLSVAEAAELTGKARSTITRAIKAGKLPNSQLDDTGAYTVHVHDLIAAHMLDTVTKQPSAVHQKQIDALVRERDELQREVDRLTRENRELGQANIDLKEWISDLRQQRDLISNNTAALAALQEAVIPLALPAATQSSSPNVDDDQSSTDAATAAGSGRKKGLFRRLLNGA